MLLFHVEEQAFIYREMINDGGISFRQWQDQNRK